MQYGRTLLCPTIALATTVISVPFHLDPTTESLPDALLELQQALVLRLPAQLVVRQSGEGIKL